MGKIKVGIVNYLNAAPLVYGLKNSAVNERIELIPDYPANLARDLKNNVIDIGLVPVAIIPELQNVQVIGDYCIGSDGAVASVCIFSEVPIEEVTEVMLDYQSRTSVQLAKILLKHYWRRKVTFIAGTEDFRDRIRGTTAAVVIGDRALEQSTISKYRYDLGAAWKIYTGLPFVFAAWIANRTFDQQFIQLFNEANAFGLKNINKVIEAQRHSLYDLEKYFKENIDYSLDDNKRKGLDQFLLLLAESNEQA